MIQIWDSFDNDINTNSIKNHGKMQLVFIKPGSFYPTEPFCKNRPSTLPGQTF